MHVVGVGLDAHQDHLLALLRLRLGPIGIEHRRAVGGAGGRGEPRGQHLHACLGVDAPVQQLRDRRPYLIEQGFDATRLMPGTGASAIPDGVELTRAAVEAGAGGVLVLPPFYYKNVSEDGVFAYYAEVIERVGDARLRVYLYHIPQLSGVPITPALVARLVDRYGPTIAGLKDSSGNWENTAMLLKQFPALSIFPGSERFLLQGLAAGGAGCITATANYDTALIRRVIDTPDGAERERLNRRMVAVRTAFEQHPTIPGLKYALAKRTGNPAWTTVRPPLRPLPDVAGQALLVALKAAESG